MASPQIENGYLKIANELVDNLCKTSLNKSESKILWTVFRKVYGWNKMPPRDKISLTQFTQLTGMTRSRACKAINSLVSRGILGSVRSDTRDVTTYWIGKNYDKWEHGVQRDTSVPMDTKGSVHIGNRVVSQWTHTKDTIQKTIKNKHCPISFKELWDKYPSKVGKRNAERHFKLSVKTEKDWIEINAALNNYLKSERVNRGFVQNGSTWFNNWKDWIEYKEDICQYCKGKGRYISATGYEIVCKCKKGVALNVR